MRIDLKVPYEEKDAAKRLGAMWDPSRKVWHLIDPDDLAPFARWIGIQVQRHGDRPNSKRARIKAQQADPRNRPPKIRPVSTMQTDNGLPNCGCTHIAPWDDCDHSGELVDLTAEQAEHMRAIASE